MKTQSFNPLYAARAESVPRAGAPVLNTTVAQQVFAALAAALPATAIMVLTLWALQSGALTALAAGYWAMGFVFLAASIETGGRTALWAALSGLALMLLAWLASRVSPDFAILAGVVASTWLSPLFLKWGRLTRRARA